ncbi:MAG TPA: TonB family protein [Candidatus Limnocylindrales bacterium]|nr:TonB family protein [Candidatus Limnocylindrales bacterium]
MPNNRTIAACVALSFLAHLVIVAAASLVPWRSRAPESVMIVDLADLPRVREFLPPKPGILEGGPPKPPPKPEKQPRAEQKPLPPPREMVGRVPDLPVDPALPPEERFLPQKSEVPPPAEAPTRPPELPRVAERPGSSGEPPPGAAADPGGSAKPLKDLNPSLGKMVLAMGETASREPGAGAGKNVGTREKAGESGGIVEEGGEGAHLTALNAPEIQYISYFAGIKRKIELVWGYPAAAGGVEGDVVADFVIGRSGRLESVTLIRGSGNRLLDDEALGAIRKASPYDPIPSQYKIANLQIRAHFIYTVTHTRILR